jgi:hypothetical protein
VVEQAGWLAGIGAARKISKNDINSFKEGQRTILTKELQMKGEVAWDTAISTIIHQSNFKDNLPECSYINEQRKAQDSDVTFVRCPKCPALGASDCRFFQHNDLDTQHRCIECGKLGAVMDWLCNCDTNWHCCNVHRFARAYAEPKQKADNQNINFNAAGTHKKANKSKNDEMDGRRKIQIDANNKDTKRLREPGMDERQYDDIQFAAHRQHLKRGREPDQNRLIILGNPIHSGLKPNLCGPMIKRRFIDTPGRCSFDPSIPQLLQCVLWSNDQKETH